ncbi:MAG: methyltransferase domain-containing protein, partial [Minisyncoccia bacterium]
DNIVRQCEISSKDIVYELGCGRGRCCFWLNCLLKCKVVGIEYIPAFIEKANHVKTELHFDNIEFRLGDILDADYSGATVLYLYGTCYDAPFLKKLLKKLNMLPSGTKIITVSYHLTDYSADYEVMKRFPAEFTWGTGDVYLQIKR